MIVCFLLKHFGKETGVTYPTKLVKMPRLQKVTAKPYSSEELKKLFGAMESEEYVRYLFFVHSGCREQEVQYAEWDDIDFDEGTYTVRPKNDVGFVPKSFEERTVPLTSELLDVLTGSPEDSSRQPSLDIHQRERRSGRAFPTEVQSRGEASGIELRPVRGRNNRREVPRA